MNIKSNSIKQGIIWMLGLGWSIGVAAQPHFQSEPGNSHYRDYELLINPAFVGAANGYYTAIGFYKQWAGNASPVSEIAQYHMPVAQSGGVGAWVHNESYGVSNNLQIGAAYAYKIRLKNNFLSFGLSLSALMLQEGYVKKLHDDVEDPLFIEPLSSQFGFNAGFGVYYSGEKFYAGVSIPQLLTNELLYEKKDGKLENSFKFDQLQYYLTGGYRFTLSEKIDLTPSALLALSSYTSTYELMLAASYNRRFEVGAGYAAYSRLQFAFGAVVLKNLSLHYRYTHQLGDDYRQLGGSHFIVLSFGWGRKQPANE